MLALFRRAALAFVALWLVSGAAFAAQVQRTYYRTIAVDGVKIFYREAGDPKAPAILLLHGLPSSSHMFRDLIPLLSDRYHVIAPDFPGFGFSDAPDRAQFEYSFENLSKVISRFTELAGLHRYAMYAAVPALVLNLAVSVLLTFVFRAVKVDGGSDVTDAAAYVG